MLFFVACQQDESLPGGKTGYLRLTVSEDNTTNSRAVPEEYKPKQIAVQIVNAEGEVIKETEDAALWEKPIELPVGTYTIKAASNGFDGKAAGFEIPYYTGNKDITITSGCELNEIVKCTLANVKVTASFDETLLSKVKSVSVRVYDASGTYSLIIPQTETRSAYFPVVEALKADVTVVNTKGESHTLTQQLGDANGKVNAKDHYILNIRLGNSGSSNISVTVDETTHEYGYTFHLSTVPTENAQLSAGAWDRLAYLKAENVTVGSGVNLEGMKFQYRTVASGEEGAWTDVKTEAGETSYTAFATDLTAATDYQYRLVTADNTQIGAVQTFTTGETDAQTPLQNGGFEDWCTVGKNAFPNKSADVKFWDTSNTGANTLSAKNPTNQVTEPVVAGVCAAKLESMTVVTFFAAASLYTGSFGAVHVPNATLNFGQSFVSRPIALHGYYQYTPVNVDNVGDNLPADATVSRGNPDQCAIYIALAKKSYEINNGDVDTFIDFEGDNNIIAYGTLEGDYVMYGKDKVNGYTEFTIPLQYKESQFGEQPTHIIIVCSASKYGDYMTGGKGSTLYVDEFSLVYEGIPAIWENK